VIRPPRSDDRPVNDVEECEAAGRIPRAVCTRMGELGKGRAGSADVSGARVAPQKR
jgi:hypothetical protein